MIELNPMTDCNWFNIPAPSEKTSPHSINGIGPQTVEKTSDISDNSVSKERLTYAGLLKKGDIAYEVIALIIGVIQRAPVEPYRFGKSKFDFELKYIDSATRRMYNEDKLEKSPLLITINLKHEAACTSLYSTSGHGFTVRQQSVVKFHGQLLVVDSKDGSLISRIDVGRHVVNVLGHLKIYVCDENIILLDNKNQCFQIDGGDKQTIN